MESAITHITAAISTRRDASRSDTPAKTIGIIKSHLLLNSLSLEPLTNGYLKEAGGRKCRFDFNQSEIYIM